MDPVSMRARDCGPSEGLLDTPSAGTQKKGHNLLLYLCCAVFMYVACPLFTALFLSRSDGMQCTGNVRARDGRARRKLALTQGAGYVCYAMRAVCSLCAARCVCMVYALRCVVRS